MRHLVVLSLVAGTACSCAIAEPTSSLPRTDETIVVPSEALADEQRPVEQREEQEEEEGSAEDLPHYFWNRLLKYYRPDPYMLDHVPRAADKPKGKLECPDMDIVRYRGETIRYRRTVWVNPAFKERLKRFEKIAARVGEEVYGRAPDRLFQRGTYVCKVIRHRRYRYSEHALGNAIDITAFGFPPLPREERGEMGELGRRFRITVLDDWNSDEHREHQIFWRRLAEETIAEFAFRGAITPPDPGHLDHLHFDMGRWRYFRGDLSLPPFDPS